MQLWRLTGFELKKAMGNRFFMITFALLLLVNILIWGGNWKNFGFFRGQVEETGEICRELDAMAQEEQEAFEIALTEKYGEGVFSLFFPPTEEFLSGPGYFGERFSDFKIVNTYVTLQETKETIRTSYENVLKAAKQFGREALRAGDDYGVRRNLNIIRLYSVPPAELHSLVESWDDFLFGRHTMLLVLLVILPCCAGTFTREKNLQTWLLLHTSKNGKGKTLVAKFLAAGIIAAGTTILFQGVSLLMVYFNYGLLGMSESVSGIEELMLFPFLFNVGQYVLLALGCQIFAAVTISVILCAVSALSNSNIVSSAVGVLLLGCSVLLTFYPPDIEWFAGPLALIRPERYFASYYTVNLFGYPVMGVLVQTVLWCVAGTVCIVVSAKVYHRKRRKI